MRVLISGGARGIGAACVRQFARDGHSVAFIYRSAHEAAQKLCDECGAMAICADVSKSDEAREAVSKAIETLGGIDVLVNNAGIAQIKMFCDITDEDLAKMLNTNLSSAFYVTRAALPSMVSQNGAGSSTSAQCGVRSAHPAKCITQQARRDCVE
jgi:3-oxoacyl-[acyl-carrier protein] reductase